MFVRDEIIESFIYIASYLADLGAAVVAHDPLRGTPSVVTNVFGM